MIKIKRTIKQVLIQHVVIGRVVRLMCVVAMLLHTTSARAQGNRVFEGVEKVAYRAIDLSTPGGQTWSTHRGATPGYFSAVGTASYTSPADAAANVDGYVKHYADVANQSFSFPVGTGADYRELGVSGTRTDTSEIAVAWIVGDPTTTADPTAPNAGTHNVSTFGTGLSAVSPIGQWDWQDVSGDAAGVTVTVSIPDMTALGAAADLRLVGWDGTEWVNLSGTTGASGNTENSTLSGTMIAGISALGIGRGETDVCITPKVFLQGALYLSANDTMTDDLRLKGLLPTTEPYTSLTGFTHAGSGGGETTTAAIFATTGNNAIVDWVFVELRDKTTNTTIVETRSALLQRDGDVVDAADGASALCFSGLVDPEVFVSIRHRNHLGVMIAATKTLTPAGTVADFSIETLFGSNAAGTGIKANNATNTVTGLWPGNTNGNTSVIEDNNDSDLDPILNTVLNAPGNGFGSRGFSYNNVYLVTDVDMNGNVIYDNITSDRDPILNTVLSYPSNGFGSRGFIGVVERLP